MRWGVEGSGLVCFGWLGASGFRFRAFFSVAAMGIWGLGGDYTIFTLSGSLLELGEARW